MFAGNEWSNDAHDLEMKALKDCQELCSQRPEMVFHVFTIDQMAAQHYEQNKIDQHVKYYPWKLEADSWNEYCQEIARVGWWTKKKAGTFLKGTKFKIISIEDMKDDKVEPTQRISGRV
jgi:hypothetical protein